MTHSKGKEDGRLECLMDPSIVVRRAVGVAFGSVVACALGIGCAEEQAEPAGEGAAQTVSEDEPSGGGEKRAPATDGGEAVERAFPLHGLITGVQLRVRAEPEPDAPILGWVRVGARVRLAPDPEPSDHCASGWYRIAPRGWVCRGEGVRVEKEPPRAREGDVVQPPPGETALPYDYYFVTVPMTPEYHRLPSRDEQRAAKAFGQRHQEILEEDGKEKAKRFLKGELPGEPKKPSVVRRYLERGFYIAGTGVEMRAFRRFVRTVWGSFVKESRTQGKSGSSFHGLELGGDGGRALPVPFALRTIRPLIREGGDGGSYEFVDGEEAGPIERQSVVDAWVERTRVGSRIYHRLELEGEPRWTRSWYIGVAETRDPPFELRAPDEPWVHVDLSEQTLVLYEGKEPTFVTLVSTGVEEHKTPTGTFAIHEKRVSDTMADLGPEAGEDRYSIDDVPWAQYFEGATALHGTFWHARFGLQKSHGCVNLSPRDAHRVFRATWPAIPDGWHGVETEGTDFRASRVVVTE